MCDLKTIIQKYGLPGVYIEGKGCKLPRHQKKEKDSHTASLKN